MLKPYEQPAKDNPIEVFLFDDITDVKLHTFINSEIFILLINLRT